MSKRSPVYTATLPIWSVNGLKDIVLKGVRNSIATVQDLELAMGAAVSMEAMLNVILKQAAPSVTAATAQATEGQVHGPVCNIGSQGRGRGASPTYWTGLMVRAAAETRMLAGHNNCIRLSNLHSLHQQAAHHCCRTDTHYTGQWQNMLQ